MSLTTPHKFHGAPVRFDELEPFGEITMSTKTFEHLTHTKVIDPSLPVRGDVGAIPRAGKPVLVPAPAPVPEEPNEMDPPVEAPPPVVDSENPATELGADDETPSVPAVEDVEPPPAT